MHRGRRDDGLVHRAGSIATLSVIPRFKRAEYETIRFGREATVVRETLKLLDGLPFAKGQVRFGYGKPGRRVASGVWRPNGVILLSRNGKAGACGIDPNVVLAVA